MRTSWLIPALVLSLALSAEAGGPHSASASHPAHGSSKGSSSKSSSSSSHKGSSSSKHGDTYCSTCPRDSHGRIKRSPEVKHSFEQSHPCPSTGKASGKCPGYVVDHVKPLACGGADSPSNMQWQTTAAAKAQDNTEGNGCKR